MQFVIVFAAVIAVAMAGILPHNAAPIGDAQAHIVSQQSAIAPDQAEYSYSSQTSNGISASEQGRLIQARSAEQSAAYVVQGQYSYIGADGQQYSVRYSADENGFHPEGSHLPVAPIA